MRLNVGPFIMVATLLVLPSIAHAQPSRVEQKRREILDKLGLDKAPPPAPATPDDNANDAPDGEPAAPSADAPADTTAAKPAPPSFRRQIHPWLMKSCQSCHQKDGPAGGTAFVLGQGLTADHAKTMRQVNTKAPARSALVLEATGQNHGGGTVAPPGSPVVRRLIAWIAAGASLEDDAAGGAVAAAPAPLPTAPTRRPPPPRRPVATPAVPPQAKAPVEPEAKSEIPTQAQATPEPSTQTGVTPRPPAAPAYSEAVHGVLIARCQSCHNAKGMAARSRFVLQGDVGSDYGSARAMVVPGSAATSPLLAKATGQAHMKVLEASSADHLIVAAWINTGAQGPFPAPSAPAQDEATASEQVDHDIATAAPAAAPSTAPPPAPPAAHPHASAYPGGLNLPMGLRLNGRFDMAFERRGISAHPFAQGQTQFQNYHHFLFLSRDEADDPVTFTVELVALTFWEAHVRVTPRQAPVQVWLKVGKLIVPFGAEPLFHQSYGGLQGFDQRVLPVFWAQNGVGARLHTNVHDVSVMADAYAVRGYALREDGDVLNLQSHFSPNDDVRPSYGARLNLSWRSLSGYYSLIVNGLGFGRTLVMQALDLNMWRWHGVPVLDRLTLGFGALRADVSGGGAGNDYYHFASYAQLRFYITDSVFVQYRQGLRTFNNRRGVLQDSTRFTADDGSTHNVGVVWRHRGLSVGAYQFWNLEKVNEVRDDFFRLMVAYEF